MGQRLQHRIALAIADERGISVTVLCFDMNNRLREVGASSRNLALRRLFSVGEMHPPNLPPPKATPSDSQPDCTLLSHV